MVKGVRLFDVNVVQLSKHYGPIVECIWQVGSSTNHHGPPIVNAKSILVQGIFHCIGISAYDDIFLT